MQEHAGYFFKYLIINISCLQYHHRTENLFAAFSNFIQISELNLQRIGYQCGGGGANMKCSVLQWSWKTLMNKFYYQ